MGVMESCWDVLENVWEVVKNYGYEDEEVVFESSNLDTCIAVCDEYHKKFGHINIYGVYHSDKMGGFMIKAILAHGLNGEIGQNGDMPWGRSLPKDLEYFKKVTLDQKVVMGRKTFDSLPFNLGLPYRDNIILTSDKLTRGAYHETGHCTAFLNSKAQVLQCHCEDDTLWLIGGASIYKQFWEHITEAHITTVKHSFPQADTFFKPDLTGFVKVGEAIDVSSDKFEASVQVWRRVL